MRTLDQLAARRGEVRMRIAKIEAKGQYATETEREELSQLRREKRQLTAEIRARIHQPRLFD